MNKYDIGLDLNNKNSLSVLIGRVVPNSFVLEFGPANGRMTKYLKEELGCKVYAVEIDAVSAKDAMPYTEDILIDNVENYNWLEKYKDIKFDFIIFADVLEHLYNPKNTLEKCKSLLSENGSILISIPNIAHNAIVIDLLKNEFNYHSTGLLDNTHIRFFTKKTFDALITECGLHRAYETAIFHNPENTEFLNSYDDLTTEISNYLKSLPFGEAYQLLYELKQDSDIKLISDFSEELKIFGKYFAQLFIDLGNGMSEKNSIKLPVAQNINSQEFVFDLSGEPNIQALRFDPLNESCVIEVEKILLVTDLCEIDLTQNLSTNATTNLAVSYFFETVDPQIYFKGLSTASLHGALRLSIRLRYAHIGMDALKICIERLDEDNRDSKHQLNQTKAELNQTKAELNQTRIDDLSKIKYLENEINKYALSLSWSITRPLRKIKKLFRGNQ